MICALGHHSKILSSSSSQLIDHSTYLPLYLYENRFLSSQQKKASLPISGAEERNKSMYVIGFGTTFFVLFMYIYSHAWILCPSTSEAFLSIWVRIVSNSSKDFISIIQCYKLYSSRKGEISFLLLFCFILFCNLKHFQESQSLGQYTYCFLCVVIKILVLE